MWQISSGIFADGFADGVDLIECFIDASGPVILTRDPDGEKDGGRPLLS